MAGNNIKGITVEINGETGPLNTALKGVNKSSYDLKSELKQVEKALKLDPKNTVLLQQKQELLAKSVTNTKEKLETLKTAEEQAQQKFAEGKISEEQYRALQREVINTEQELHRLETAASNSNVTLNRISETSDKIAKGAKGVGTAMTPVTAAIGGIATGAVAAFTEVDKGMDIVIKKTGATGETSKELEKIYKDLGSSVPDSMEEVGSAIGEINTRFEFTGDTLKNASEDFLKFAKINDIDVNSSVQLVSRAMGDAGIKSSEYNSVLDKLTVAAQKSGIGMDSLTENLAKYGAPMRALGIDTNTSIAMFAGWEKAGVNTEIAFAGMKKAISNWGSQGKDSSKEFEKTLEAIKKAPNIAKATSMAIDVFGQKAGPDLADAIQGGRFEVQDYVEALKKSEGAVTNTYAGIESGTDKAKTAFNAMKIAGGELGDTIMKTLTPILTDIAVKAKAVADKFAGLSEGTKKTILIVMAVIAAIAPLAFLISGIATIVSKVTKSIKILTTAIKFMTGPIGLTILAVAALVIGFTYLWTHCEGFRTFWISLWNGIKTITKVTVDALVNFFTVTIPGAWNGLKAFFTGIPAWFSNLWTGVKTTTTTVWTSIGTFFTTLWTGIQTFFVTIWNLIVSGVMAILNPFIQGVINIFNSMKDGFTTIFEGIKLYFTGVWMAIKLIFLGPILLILDLCTGNFGKLKTDTEKIFNGLKEAFRLIWDGIKLIFTGVVTAIAGFLKLTWDGIVNTAKTIFNGLKDFFKGLWDGIKDTAKSAWNGLKTTVVDICKSIVSGAKDVWNGLLNWFKELPGNLKTIGSNMFTSMKDGVTSTIGNVSSAVKTGMNNAIDFIKALPSEAVGWGRDMIDGIVRGIKDAAGAVGDAVKGVAQDIRSFLHFSVPDEGPLTDYESWMPDFMGGLAKGIKSSKSLVTDAIKGLSTDMSVGMSLTPAMAGMGTFKNQSLSGNTTNNSKIGSLLHTDNININNDMDIQALAEKLEFYRKQTEIGGGRG